MWTRHARPARQNKDYISRRARTTHTPFEMLKILNCHFSKVETDYSEAVTSLSKHVCSGRPGSGSEINQTIFYLWIKGKR